MQEKIKDDTISRVAAIDIVEFECGEWSGLARTIVKAIEQLPSTQPKRTEERTETHACDLIDRQAAINAINTWDKFGADERCRIVRWHEGLELYVRLRDVLTSIVNLPAAQPEIIHCRECMHHHYEKDIPYCDRIDYGYGWKDNDFCSRGERRTDE